MLPARLREYAALTNSPILYWLTYRVGSHRIGAKWAYLWLIDFARSPGLIAFHPQSLKLIWNNLPKWKNLFAPKNDFELFLDGAFPGSQEEIRQQIAQAVQYDYVLYKDENTQTWTLSYE